jgi:hypothetical protein
MASKILPRQRLRGFAALVDEWLRDGGERTVLQGDGSDWSARNAETVQAIFAVNRAPATAHSTPTTRMLVSPPQPRRLRQHAQASGARLGLPW